MHDVQDRLIKCFATVFPELSPEEIVKTTADCAANQDSLSAVTLLAVVQEEFGLDLEVDDMENLVSFKAMLERVNEAIRGKTPMESAVPDQAPA
jgi:acyl carrier protein